MDALFKSIGLVASLSFLATCAPTADITDTANEALAMAEQSGAQVSALEQRIEELEARLDEIEGTLGEVEHQQRLDRLPRIAPCQHIGRC